MPRTRWLRAGLFLAFVIGSAGCGPITSTTAIAKATVAVEAAGGASADKYAVYEYMSAREYLRKAKEEEGYSDFQAAVDLAKMAREFAEKARELAMSNPGREMNAPAPDDDNPDGETPRGVSGDRL